MACKTAPSDGHSGSGMISRTGVRGIELSAHHDPEHAQNDPLHCRTRGLNLARSSATQIRSIETAASEAVCVPEVLRARADSQRWAIAVAHGADLHFLAGTANTASSSERTAFGRRSMLGHQLSAKIPSIQVAAGQCCDRLRASDPSCRFCRACGGLVPAGSWTPPRGTDSRAGDGPPRWG